MRYNMFIRFIFIKWLSGAELFLYIKRGSVTCDHWLSLNRSSLISYYHGLIFAQIIFILDDNQFFLHNLVSFNRVIIMNILESTIQSISFHIGFHSRTFRTVWQHRQVPPLITNKLSLLVNCRVKLTGMPREDCVGSTIPMLMLGGSAPSSGLFWLAACVLGTR